MFVPRITPPEKAPRGGSVFFFSALDTEVGVVDRARRSVYIEEEINTHRMARRGQPKRRLPTNQRRITAFFRPVRCRSWVRAVLARPTPWLAMTATEQGECLDAVAAQARGLGLL